MEPNKNICPNNAAVLLDLDGVLIDSESQYTLFWDSIDRRYPTGYDDFARRIKGTTLHDILDTYFAPSLHSAINEALDDFERNMAYPLKDGVTEFLSSLQQLGVPAVLVTSSTPEKMERLWAQQPQLRTFLKDVVTSKDVKHSKPHPEGYLLGARLAGVSPEHCCVFEDSLQGVIAGHNAGAYVVGVAGTLNAQVLAPYADRVIDSLTEIDTYALSELLRQRAIIE